MPNIVLHIDAFEKIRIDKFNLEIDELKNELPKAQIIQDEDIHDINTFKRVT